MQKSHEKGLFHIQNHWTGRPVLTYGKCPGKVLESLGTDVFEPWMATGSGAFSSLAPIGDFLFINSSCRC